MLLMPSEPWRFLVVWGIRFRWMSLTTTRALRRKRRKPRYRCSLAPCVSFCSPAAWQDPDLSDFADPTAALGTTLLLVASSCASILSQSDLLLFDAAESIDGELAYDRFGGAMWSSQVCVVSLSLATLRVSVLLVPCSFPVHVARWPDLPVVRRRAACRTGC